VNVLQVNGRRLVRALERAGFLVTRQSGSHVHLFRDGRRVTVPVHGSKDLRLGTLRSILRDAGITEDELREYL
jgi:predicted RNA binding protein YcfA (HicA-like mRNA interferase family)